MCYALHEHSVIFLETEFFSGIIRKRIQLKLFVHQTDLFVRYEKNFQGEIAIRSRDIAINKKVPLECSDDRATHQKHSCLQDFYVRIEKYVKENILIAAKHLHQVMEADWSKPKLPGNRASFSATKAFS